MPAEQHIPNGPGDGGHACRLFEASYDALRGLAAGYLRGRRGSAALEPTALVHEAYLKLARGEGETAWRDKSHFRAIAAVAMRQILVDHAKRRASRKRGGDWLRVTLSPEVGGGGGIDFDLLALDEAMRELASIDPRRARVVELRFFGGMTCVEAAAEVGVAPKTAESDWYFARAWLRNRLSGGEQ